MKACSLIFSRYFIVSLKNYTSLGVGWLLILLLPFYSFFSFKSSTSSTEKIMATTKRLFFYQFKIIKIIFKFSVVFFIEKFKFYFIQFTIDHVLNDKRLICQMRHVNDKFHFRCYFNK